MGKILPVLIPLKGFSLRVNFSSKERLPLELEKGISLVKILNPSKSGTSFPVSTYKVQVKDKFDMQIDHTESDYKVFDIPEFGLLFEVQKAGRAGSFQLQPHIYANFSRKPISCLRMINDGEFLTTAIITEPFGFTDLDEDGQHPQLEDYSIDIDELVRKYKVASELSEKWIRLKINKNPAIVNLCNRAQNGIFFLNKTYFPEHSHVTTTAKRGNNFLRVVFCWLGIEALLMKGEADGRILCERLNHFLPEYAPAKIQELYDLRSIIVHSVIPKMRSIQDDDVDEIRTILKKLIFLFWEICNTGKFINDLERSGSNDSIEYLSRISSFREQKENFNSTYGEQYFELA